MKVNDFVESSSPVKRDQEIANNFVQCDIITECLPEERSDCTSSYTNKLLEYSLLREQTTQMINEKVLEEVEGPASNTILPLYLWYNMRAPHSLNLKARENDN